MHTMSEEFGLIDWIRERAHRNADVDVGIGDDAAILNTGVLVATDTLIEGVHFEFSTATPHLAGRKSLAVNLSDVAAMAGEPTAAFVAAVFPRDRGTSFARDLMQGIANLAEEFNIEIAGGDTNVHDGPTVLSVTVVGRCLHDPPPLRSHARVGDWVFVTGTLGGSLAGKHLRFIPRVREAQALAEQCELHAMIDLSDGLSSDIRHILAASGVGVEIAADAIPLSGEASQFNDDKSPLEHALHDGEDFELLFTVPAQSGESLVSDPPIDIPITRIGTVVPAGTCDLLFADGTRKPLEPLGWRHRFDF